ncbi:hypothetical protein ACFC1R_37735 [Kitasatospora sp. NPDC056138]|uniref:hypothetical protein n=1 Tax=Kitasatospora sp. NPDC056138 TaxID=3345724 RepID=UPI0035D8F9C6
MGGKYYISPDEDRGGVWEFTPDQVTRTIHSLWPQPQPIPLDTSPSSGIFDFDVQVNGESCELTYFADEQFFVIPDQDPLELPFRVVYSVLTTLAPSVPAVWMADFDGAVHSVDLSIGVENLLTRFHT